MDDQIHTQIVNFIWNIADDCLRDVYVRGRYRDVILPMTVIRRLDAVLTESGETEEREYSNESGISLKDIAGVPEEKLKECFLHYLDGFSLNIKEILEKFKFKGQVDTMMEADILRELIKKFLSPAINLSPYPVYDETGNIKLPGLENFGMGIIFEELIRRFNEDNNEETGEHFTPRDVIELMSDCIFVPIADKIENEEYSCYDGACGTGGMLTIAQKRLEHLAKQRGKEITIKLWGQEINAESYAIAKADMILQGKAEAAEGIAFGSTLSNDAFSDQKFKFILSNPPYGKSWKIDAEKLGGKKGMQDKRFIAEFEDDSSSGRLSVSMLPRVSDGQLLFMLNNISKMDETGEIGSRIAQIHNGSALFTGDAGSGESNARRYMIENDLVEAVIALPENMFYNTGIATYIWILSNKKAPERKGRLQLIDATSLKEPLRKHMGNKGCALTENIRKQILSYYLNMEENEYSKIFENSEFGYWKITVQQPLLDEAGNPQKEKKGRFKPDKERSDAEQVPFSYKGGIDAFMENEIKPYSPYAWIDEKKTQIGYEICFRKYFYRPVQLRELEEISADIENLETEVRRMLTEILKPGLKANTRSE